MNRLSLKCVCKSVETHPLYWRPLSVPPSPPLGCVMCPPSSPVTIDHLRIRRERDWSTRPERSLCKSLTPETHCCCCSLSDSVWFEERRYSYMTIIINSYWGFEQCQWPLLYIYSSYENINTSIWQRTCWTKVLQVTLIEHSFIVIFNNVLRMLFMHRSWRVLCLKRSSWMFF